MSLSNASRQARAAFLRQLTAPKNLRQTSCTLPYRIECLSSNIKRRFSHRATRRQEAFQALLKSTTEHAVNPEQTAQAVSYQANLPDLLSACPGCGAPCQTLASSEAGFYTTSRKQVKWFFNNIQRKEQKSVKAREEELVAKALEKVRENELESATQTETSEPSKRSKRRKPRAQEKDIEMPLCDRCHDLLHHSSGTSIAHPSLESIRSTISESPYRYNHIYHVIDAADFPMSLIDGIHSFLGVSPQRTKNRRARHAQLRGGSKSELTFIISRADLLAAKKEQVDRLMPYLTQVLRKALATTWNKLKMGRDFSNIRLGNVRCVSAKKGWWTMPLRADIWGRGGGGWMIGKVNVGKSKLFEAVFPKNRAENLSFANRPGIRPATAPSGLKDHRSLRKKMDSERDERSMLPKARDEVQYPQMPAVSSVAGTTASPIRIPFGNGRGELIDMPGLARTSLESCLLPEQQKTLLLDSRVIPEQQTIAPGQSLLLAGLVRITNPGKTTILAYPFMPMKSHLTSTTKALEVEEGSRSRAIPYVVTDEALSQMALAGKYDLSCDVTKRSAARLLSKTPAELEASDLPFQSFSVDILVESLGWVELVTEIRRPHKDKMGEEVTEEAPLPFVEVYSPQGKFIGHREPMGAYSFSQEKPTQASSKRRPRGSKRRNRRGPRS